MCIKHISTLLNFSNFLFWNFCVFLHVNKAETNIKLQDLWHCMFCCISSSALCRVNIVMKYMVNGVIIWIAKKKKKKIFFTGFSNEVLSTCIVVVRNPVFETFRDFHHQQIPPTAVQIERIDYSFEAPWGTVNMQGVNMMYVFLYFR